MEKKKESSDIGPKQTGQLKCEVTNEMLRSKHFISYFTLKLFGLFGAICTLFYIFDILTMIFSLECYTSFTILDNLIAQQ